MSNIESLKSPNQSEREKTVHQSVNMDMLKVLLHQFNVPFDIDNLQSRIASDFGFSEENPNVESISDSDIEIESDKELIGNNSEDNNEFDFESDKEIESDDFDSCDNLSESDFFDTTEPIQKIINLSEKSKIESIKNENKFSDTLRKEVKNILQEIPQEELKITLNVGGKKFHFNKNLLERLNIKYDRLEKIKTNDNHPIYFLDRDSYYFSQIIEIIRKYGTDSENIIPHIGEYSDQLVNELCYYTLLDKKFLPKSKLKLKRSVKFFESPDLIPNEISRGVTNRGSTNNTHISTPDKKQGNIIKIIVKKQSFETLVSTLTKSVYFSNILKSHPAWGCEQIINVDENIDIDPKLFRYILNFLRHNEMYISNHIIENYLREFGIEYEFTECKKIHHDIVLNYEPYNTITLSHQFNEIPQNFHPHFRSTSTDGGVTRVPMFEMENLNIIDTKSPKKFGSDILFDLGENNFGNIIDDILLCIDIPVLDPKTNLEYDDLFEYKLIENLNLIITDNQNNSRKIILTSKNEYQYIYPLVYSSKSDDYHKITKIEEKKMKIMYQDNLIDIKRIILPLFLFKSKRNSLPIKQILETNKSAHLIVKTSHFENIIRNNSNKPLPDIPLLNICLMANYVSMTNIILPNSYIFDRLHTTVMPITATDNAIYNTTAILLDKIGFIKEFFFVILSENDHCHGKIDVFQDDLIDVQILYQHEHKLIVHSCLDSIVMNSYTPLKKLGHTLPQGVYYHSFSSAPLESYITGGLWGKNYILQIKTKKTNRSVIKFYGIEYFEQSF